MTIKTKRVTISKARKNQFLEIAQLDRRSWGKDSTFIPDGEHTWRIWCEYSTVLVARCDGKIVGAALLIRGNHHDDVLHKIFVTSSMRGRGIGSRLMKAILKSALRPVILTVNPANTGAIAVYEKFDFRRKRLVKGFYREWEDRYVMVWQPMG
jgi:ribosomal protein S18 acetylase RimI-like enzyme